MEIWPPSSEALWGFFGVVTGVVATIASELVRHRAAKKTQTTYLAVRVVTTLDQFAVRCDQAIRDIDTSNKMVHPLLTFEKLDVDWKAIKSAEAYRILSLPSEIAAARSKSELVLQHWHDHAFDENVKSEFCYLYSVAASDALSLAGELRLGHALGPPREAIMLLTKSFQNLILLQKDGREIHERNHLLLMAQLAARSDSRASGGPGS